MVGLGILSLSVNAQKKQTPKTMPSKTKMHASADAFNYECDRFADIQVIRYQIKGFDKLSAKQRKLAYYLYEAALSGRDIIYDQKYKHNLAIRKTIEVILNNYKGDRNSPDFKSFEEYAKQFFFSNGIHHHYANTKHTPKFSKDYFVKTATSINEHLYPLSGSQTLTQFLDLITPSIFDKNVDYKGVNLDKDADHVQQSANNFYNGLTQKEVEDYYATKMDKNDKTPISYGLNSQLVKENGQIVERPWKVGGLYSGAISKIVYWLEKAVAVAENDQQKLSLSKLIQYYNTGDLKIWDEYNIAWVADKTSQVDVVNGFIEVYGDAMGKRGSYESCVSFKDMEASKKIEAIGGQAQWFEDHSPIAPEHKKKSVKGITAKSITVVVESGDAAPSTPVGINLPNANWIRQEYGSKSVSLGNIVEAYNVVGAKSPSTQEFAYDKSVLERLKKYGALAGELHTDMHEVIGHASGQINPGIATPDVTLKNYANTLEEARADLVALYYIMDSKLVTMGVMPSLEVGMAEYDTYLMNGLMTQLNRIEFGANLEEAHMRNRQLNSSWAFERGVKAEAVEKVVRQGKTYIHIKDYVKMREIFGQLLKEIQRIKSEGDYAAATALVEGYGVKVDVALHKEVKERFSQLNVAPYKGFIQPRLVPIMKADVLEDVKVEYPTNFLNQMLEYGDKYSLLPVTN